MIDRPKRVVQLARPCLGQEEVAAVQEVLASGWLIQGPKVASFEAAFTARHKVDFGIAVTSGTSALHVALEALGIGEGDEVIVPALTWVATANAALYVGATPVFVDIDPATYNIDPRRIAGAVTDRTKAILPVHLFGLPADMDAVRSVVPEGVMVIEDAACAAGAAIGNRPVGAIGDAACFSFHARKSITTGEGGMVTTNDAAIARRASEFRDHGLNLADSTTLGGPGPHYMADVEILGFNFRMRDIQAAIGLAQLAKLDRFIDERDRWAQWYGEELADIAWLSMPTVPKNMRHAWQSFVVIVSEDRTAERNRIMAQLTEAGIGTRPGTHAITDLSYYRDRYGVTDGDVPAATAVEQRSISLPLHNEMTEDDYRYVTDVLHGL